MARSGSGAANRKRRVGDCIALRALLMGAPVEAPERRRAASTLLRSTQLALQRSACAPAGAPDTASTAQSSRRRRDHRFELLRQRAVSPSRSAVLDERTRECTRTARRLCPGGMHDRFNGCASSSISAELRFRLLAASAARTPSVGEPALRRVRVAVSHSRRHHADVATERIEQRPMNGGGGGLGGGRGGRGGEQGGRHLPALGGRRP